MGKNQISLVLGLVSAIAIIGVTIYATDDDVTSCMDNVRELADVIEMECEWEYIEWGYDSPQQCTNDKIGTLPDCG